MSRAMGLATVAEGVEAADLARWLQERGARAVRRVVTAAPTPAELTT